MRNNKWEKATQQKKSVSSNEARQKFVQFLLRHIQRERNRERASEICRETQKMRAEKKNTQTQQLFYPSQRQQQQQ